MTIAVDVFQTQPVSDYKTVVRPQLKTGDIMLCSGSAFFSNLIKEGTQSPFSHTAFVAYVTEINRYLVLESVESIGIRAVPISRYLEDYDGKGNPYPGGIVIARHNKFGQVSVDQLKQFAQFGVGKLGYKYNTDDIAKIAARIAVGEVGINLPSLTVGLSQTAYICSEYVYACYKNLGISLQWDAKGFIAPSDIALDPDVQLIGVIKK